MSDLQADSYSDGILTGKVCTPCEVVDGLAYIENDVVPSLAVGSIVAVDGVEWEVADITYGEKTVLALAERT